LLSKLLQPIGTLALLAFIIYVLPHLSPPAPPEAVAFSRFVATMMGNAVSIVSPEMAQRMGLPDEPPKVFLRRRLQQQ
jgi:hypothetical protein